MQAWNQVKVTAEGKHQGKAGLVLRSEGQGVEELVTVRLDEQPDTPEVFAASELVLLG